MNRPLHPFLPPSLPSGCYVLSAQAYSAYYEKAMALRVQLKKEFRQAFEKVDVLLTPTTPEGPFPIDTPKEPSSLLMNDVMTVPVNLAGLPAISVPVGVSSSTKKKKKKIICVFLSVWEVFIFSFL